MRLAWLGAGVLVGASALVGSGCQGTAPERAPLDNEPGQAKQAIQDGTVDSTNTYKFAVGVCNGSGAVNSGNCGGICSGALILPNVVATARHCVDDSPEQIDCTTEPTFGARQGSSFRITTNPTMAGAASGWYGVQQIAVPTDNHVCGNDLALLILSSSVPESVVKPITPGVQYLMWDPTQYESKFVAIGYGNTSPSPGTAGTRRVSSPIDVLCVPGSTMPCPPGASFDEQDFIGGDGPCKGDSGSSAFESSNLAKGTPVSFGVLSRGGKNDTGTKCQYSFYTRFDKHRDFVIAVAKQASNNWSSYPEPAWTEFKPPYKAPPKDAGAPKGDAGTTAKPTLPLGEACAKLSDCASGLCTDPGDGTLVCSQACEDSSTCGDGFECRDSLCLAPIPDGTPAAAPATTTTTSCAATAVSSSSTGGRAWAAAMGLALAIGAIRRRKR